MSDMPTGTKQGGPTRLREAFDLAMLGAAIALLAGFAEVVVMTTRVEIIGMIVWTTRDYAWMTPASWLIYFALPALVAAAVVAAFPWRARPSCRSGSSPRDR